MVNCDFGVGEEQGRSTGRRGRGKGERGRGKKCMLVTAVMTAEVWLVRQLRIRQLVMQT